MTGTAVVLVTGGGKGIGRGIAQWYTAREFAVIIAQRTAAEAQEAAAAIAQEQGGNVTGLGADLSTAAGCRELMAQAIAAHGRIDVLVNNAAVTGPAAVGPFLEFDDERLDSLVDTNLKAVFRCSRAAARDMVARDEPGVIVNVSSVAAYAAQDLAAAYTATKFALTGLTKALALELAPHGIRVVGVAPGDIDVTRPSHPVEGTPRWQRDTPLGRRGSPADVAATVGFLSSDDAGFITGETVVVDGGWLTY